MNTKYEPSLLSQAGPFMSASTQAFDFDLPAVNAFFVFKDNDYFVEGENFSDNGRFMLNEISNSTLLQFRSSTGVKYFSGYYSAEYAKITRKETDRRGRVKETVIDDTDTILLQSVIVSPDGFFATETQPLALHKTALRKTDE